MITTIDIINCVVAVIASLAAIPSLILTIINALRSRISVVVTITKHVVFQKNDEFSHHFTIQFQNRNEQEFTLSKIVLEGKELYKSNSSIQDFPLIPANSIKEFDSFCIVNRNAELPDYMLFKFIFNRKSITMNLSIPKPSLRIHL